MVRFQVIELELSTGIPMLYVAKDGKFMRRGSPVGPTVTGVFALTPVRKEETWDGSLGFHPEAQSQW